MHNTQEIRQFILDHVGEHPQDITSLTAEKYGITRQAVLRHIHQLVKEDFLVVRGTTRDRYYELKPFIHEEWKLDLQADLQEDQIWRQKIRPFFFETAWNRVVLPRLSKLSSNVIAICQYGFTEILNNAIDHSEGKSVRIGIKCTAVSIKLMINDDGVGIFHKIQQQFNLDDPRDAILELAKGKVTTDPARHTGEGIFFASRAFDRFSIVSGNLCFIHVIGENDWLLEDAEGETLDGTLVTMEIHPAAKRSLQAIFDYFASESHDYGFTRTIVPVVLAKYGEENLVSRSQAKRLLTRFDRFREILLDFKNIEFIGQAFADEIFRVYQSEHPQLIIQWVNANEQVGKMIQRSLPAESKT